MTRWTDDPSERTRFADGEGTPEERSARARDLVTDPVARARVALEIRTATLVRSTAALEPRATAALEQRVRAALAARARRPVLLPRILSMAAALLLAVGAAFFAFQGRVEETSAAGREFRLAVEALRRGEAGTLPTTHAGGSCEEGVASPHRFPLVVNGEAAVESCTNSEGETVSVLTRDGGAADRTGLVVVPWDGKSSATDVGFTRFEDVVVFDVAIGRAKYYLATRWDGVAGTPACAACHGPVRASNPARNPHLFVQRDPAALGLGE